jgi:dGTPase
MKPRLYNDGDYNRIALIPKSGSPEPYRSDFRRDYARVLHCPAFRRLQRKTQLFPGEESDFFRNRLTHSLEVAQISKSIALRLNYLIERSVFRHIGSIDLDLVEIAGLAHDLGHPPFGHTGEHALHQRMQTCGGFEGNAQTLRIVSKLEKRQTVNAEGEEPTFTEFASDRDQRAGLNLCFRSLASILKYDNCIPLMGSDSLQKGYYKSEEDLVQRIKRAVLGENYRIRENERFRVIEMQIMDLADDIAYSTYDFEDELEAGFASPLDLLQQLNNNEELRDSVAKKLFKTYVGREYSKENPSDDDAIKYDQIKYTMDESVLDLLEDYFIQGSKEITSADRKLFGSKDRSIRAFAIATISVKMQKLSDQIAKNGYARAQLTSDVIGKRIRSVDIEVDESVPALSKIKIPEETRFQIDVLKHLTYELHIKSPRLKLIEYRGTQIVKELFDCFDSDAQGELFPQDWRDRLVAFAGFRDGKEMRKRLVCDFVAGMTDAYALDMYSRLKTTNPAALFRPI